MAVGGCGGRGSSARSFCLVPLSSTTAPWRAECAGRVGAAAADQGRSGVSAARGIDISAGASRPAWQPNLRKADGSRQQGGAKKPSRLRRQGYRGARACPPAEQAQHTQHSTPREEH